MKNKLASRFLISTVLVLLFYTVLAVAVIIVANNQSIESGLVSLSRNITQDITDKDEFLNGRLPYIYDSVTVIDTDGNVIDDSRIRNNADFKQYTLSDFNNQSQYPEFLAAMEGRPKVKTHDDDLTGKVNAYYSVLVEDRVTGEQFIVRVSSLWSLNSLFSIIIPLIIALMILSVALSFVFVSSLTSSIMDPLENVEAALEQLNGASFKQIEYKSKYPEINKIVSNINDLSVKVSDTLKELNYEQIKGNFILANVDQGFAAVGRHKNIKLINKAFIEIFGIKGIAAGKNINEFIKDEELLKNLDAAITERKQASVEIQQGELWYRVSVAPVEGGMFDLWHVQEVEDAVAFILLTDITEEKHYQVIRNEFFANASHELKTPLTAINGYAEILLASQSDNEFVKKCTGEITANVKRMLSLIDDMMNLSKLESKVEDAAPEYVRLDEVANEVKRSLAAISDAKGIRVSIEGTAGITAPKNKIEELTVNLIDNAIKYNKENGFVKVRFFDDNDVTIMTVEDSGIGIPKEHQDRIFERFYMVNKGRNRKVQGTGLGLAIVKHIVFSLGGTIDLESEPDKGTAITVVFKKGDKKLKQTLYPMKLEPVKMDYVWGSETWLMSCHENGQNVICEGEYKGRTLADVLARVPALGGKNSKRFPFFPLLLKMIDADDKLSVQVHPSDEYALKNENQFGKTEMWYVLGAEKNAGVYCGFKERLTKKQLTESLADGSIESKLNFIPMVEGDSVFIPAGTVHAICGGLSIFEIQQNSSITYRLFDYNRVGKDGKPRELHIKKAVAVSDLKSISKKNSEVKILGENEKLLSECQYFRCWEVSFEDDYKLRVGKDSFIGLTVTEGEGALNYLSGDKEQAVQYKKGDTFFVPAGIGSVSVSGKGKVILYSVPSRQS